jgi:hypothetical protein
MGILSFWKKDKATQDQNNAVYTGVRRPMTIDLTENIKVNGELTRGLFHNSYPGYKLAGSLMYAPIAVPIAFMGLPVPVSEDKKTQIILDELLEEKTAQCIDIVTACHRDGTIWVWPYYSAKEQRLIWEVIQDDSVTDILKDQDTGSIIELVVTEQISYLHAENDVRVKTRIRRFRTDFIYDGGRIAKNVLGILPVCFSNLPDAGKIRGHSDLERIIPDGKIYHDIYNQWATVLSKFKPKMVQYATDQETWKANNGVELSTFDPGAADFVINRMDQEKTDYIFLQGVGDEYRKALEIAYYKIVQGSPTPEICWGLVSTGNHASPEAQMNALMQHVNRKQIQATEPFGELFEASIQLLSIASMQSLDTEVSIKWDDLDAMSPGTKAEVLTKFASAMKTVVDAGLPKESVYAIFKHFYPKATAATIEEFKEQMSSAARFVAWRNATYQEQADAGGEEL